MGVIAAGIVALLVLAWIGRRPQERWSAIRIGAAFAAALAAVGAVVSALRGSWLASLAFVAGSAILQARFVSRRPRPTSRTSGAMSADEARAILGVGPSAGQEEIAVAYRRLIKAVHPDAGGASPLAAQVNAAFNVLKSR